MYPNKVEKSLGKPEIGACPKEFVIEVPNREKEDR